MTLTALAEGGSGTGYTYAWYLGDDETPRQEGESDTLVLENLGCYECMSVGLMLLVR